MSDSDEEQQSYEFLGFQDIFNSTFHGVENNILTAFREYAEAQGIDDIANSQEITSLSTISNPSIESFTSELPIYTTRSAPVSPTLNRPRASVRAITASYESLSSASSSQNINYNIQPSKNITTMTLTAPQQCFTRDIRVFNKRVKAVIKNQADLDAAIKSNKSKAEIQHLVNALEVEADELDQIAIK